MSGAFAARLTVSKHIRLSTPYVVWGFVSALLMSADEIEVSENRRYCRE
jgi:hypothetical protein